MSAVRTSKILYVRGDILSPRLNALLERGVDGEDFWDICCDHGYLGEKALRSLRFPQVHFVDRVPHIIEKLKLRLDGEGLVQLLPAEDVSTLITGTVAIAGVGGYSLIKILSGWTERGNLRARRLLLNPLTHINELRDYLSVWPLYVEIETVEVDERGRTRQIIVLERRY